MTKTFGVSKTSILLAATLAYGTAQSQTTQPIPSFETSSCETVKGYDPDWASYGEEYGLKLTPKKDYDFIFGFYQMAEKDGKLYVAFGGAIGPDGPVKGARPGAVVVLNADTLQYEKAIPLPFHAHAMTLDAARNKLMVTHTSANAFSLVDLTQEQVTCLKPSTNIGDLPFRGRYIQSDEDGNFYINYNTIRNGEGASLIVKYNKDGKKDKDFNIREVEKNVAFPLFYQDGTLFAGSKGVKSIAAATGEVQALSGENKEVTMFNYTSGPAGTLLAADMNSTGKPGLYLFDLSNKTQSALFTGTTSLELAYKADAAQALVTNLESKTVTIVDLPANEKSLEGRPFRNIRISDDVDFFFRGIVSNIHLRQNTKNTEFFVTQKFWADKNLEKHGLISKITLADFVKGIDGLDKPGACTIQTFNIADKTVSEKKACRIMDEQESYAAEIERLKSNVAHLKKENSKTEKDLAQAKTKLDDMNNKKDEQSAKEIRAEITRLEQYQSVLQQDLPQAESAIGAVQNLMRQSS
ncbi:MAG TPA: hypothetical protein PK461_12325 [Alcaligenes faecalis]|nr:hypothetical protein [Alcaligenes faecalis]